MQVLLDRRGREGAAVGVTTLGKGELKSKLDLTVYSASASAAKAVEAAGGKLTTTAKVKEPAAAEA